MADEHWFDHLSKALVRSVARRQLVRYAGVFMVGRVLGRPRTAVAKHRKSNGKNKRKQNGKHKPRAKPAAACSAGACAAQWPDDSANRDYCEFICRQCDDDDPRNFCIVEADPGDPAKVAICCAEGAVCCGARCCGDPDLPELACCDGACTNTNRDRNNCGVCGFICPDGWRCCDGSCVDIENSVLDCGGCGIECALDEVCLDGVCTIATQCPFGLTDCPPQGCVDTNSHPGHCGSCGNVCALGSLRHCVHGQCGCNPASNDVACGINCIPRGYTCCPANGGYGCSNPNAVCLDDGGCG